MVNVQLYKKRCCSGRFNERLLYLPKIFKHSHIKLAGSGTWTRLLCPSLSLFLPALPKSATLTCTYCTGTLICLLTPCNQRGIFCFILCFWIFHFNTISRRLAPYKVNTTTSCRCWHWDLKWFQYLILYCKSTSIKLQCPERYQINLKLYRSLSRETNWARRRFRCPVLKMKCGSKGD